jgi:hypothetical protein
MILYITSWNINYMVKELICRHGHEGSIPSYEDLSLWACVLNDYNTITYSSDVASDMANYVIKF